MYPVFANKAFSEELSPFLMFDYGAPKSFPPNRGKPVGVGKHPHRGFETVTIAFQGEIEHGDHMGHKGVIGPVVSAVVGERGPGGGRTDGRHGASLERPRPLALCPGTVLLKDTATAA